MITLLSTFGALALFATYVTYLRLSIKKCTSVECMNGKVVIVTGANSGIGFHTSLDLARRGARVILACRDPERGTAAAEAIKASTRNTNVEYQHLNLSSLNSVRKFAAHILEAEKTLHVLINNAGVYGYAHCYTEDDILETMQINYFGHFLLTMLLLPLLKKSQPSRIINLSSNLHFFGRFNSSTINSIGSQFYNDTLAYCNSKYCMLLFSIELSRRLQGTGVVVNAAHPGVINTAIITNIPHIIRFLFWCWTLMYSRTPEQGAQTIIHLAVTKECEKVSGKYFVDCASRYKTWRSKSKTQASDLWNYSAEKVGLDKLSIY